VLTLDVCRSAVSIDSTRSAIEHPGHEYVVSVDFGPVNGDIGVFAYKRGNPWRKWIGAGVNLKGGQLETTGIYKRPQIGGGDKLPALSVFRHCSVEVSFKIKSIAAVSQFS